MFDVSWSELLILGLVTLIFVGPKELPRFLGQLGRYAGVVRRHANEFRSVFEQAMREAEMDQIQKEMRAVSEGVKASLDDATRSVESVKSAAKIDPDAKPEAAKATEVVSVDPPADASQINAPSPEPAETAEAASVEVKSTVGPA